MAESRSSSPPRSSRSTGAVIIPWDAGYRPVRYDLAVAWARQTMIITTGDKALLKTSGYAGIEVLTPKAFVAKYLTP